MFKEGTLVKLLGVFRVEAITDDFVEMDPYGKGAEFLNREYNENGAIELTAEGEVKGYDGMSVGDFFEFPGTYEVVRSNGIFTKVEVQGMLVSIPNHKIEEVA